MELSVCIFLNVYFSLSMSLYTYICIFVYLQVGSRTSFRGMHFSNLICMLNSASYAYIAMLYILLLCSKLVFIILCLTFKDQHSHNELLTSLVVWKISILHINNP